MKFFWLSSIGLMVGLLTGVVVKGTSFTTMMLVSAATVGVIELVDRWWQS